MLRLRVLESDKAKLCDQDAIARVHALIDEIINDDIRWAKSPLELRHQRCYAVKVTNTCAEIVKPRTDGHRADLTAL